MNLLYRIIEAEPAICIFFFGMALGIVIGVVCAQAWQEGKDLERQVKYIDVLRWDNERLRAHVEQNLSNTAAWQYGDDSSKTDRRSQLL